MSKDRCKLSLLVAMAVCLSPLAANSAEPARMTDRSGRPLTGAMQKQLQRFSSQPTTQRTHQGASQTTQRPEVEALVKRAQQAQFAARRASMANCQ